MPNQLLSNLTTDSHQNEPDTPNADSPKSQPVDLEAQQLQKKRPRWYTAVNILSYLLAIVWIGSAFFISCMVIFEVGMMVHNTSPTQKEDLERAELFVKPLVDRLDQLIHVINSTTPVGGNHATQG